MSTPNTLNPLRVVFLATAWLCLFASGQSWADEAPEAPGMVLIPAGEFEMGLEGPSNKTPHKVYLDAFYMDKYEVTQKEYEAVRGANPSSFVDPNAPVDQVTWLEASAYCARKGKRLPTEAEWEKAARGGTTTLYYWGDDFNEDATWNEDNSDEHTHRVGLKPANPVGLYDMSGNVWEWVSDWYDKTYYERSPAKNPPGPKTGEEKVIRGGSWYSGGRHQTTSTRYWAEPNTRNSNFGFRCASDVSG